MNTNKKKKTVKLTESELHRVIKESVNMLIKENEYANNSPIFHDKELSMLNHVDICMVMAKYLKYTNQEQDFVNFYHQLKDGSRIL